MIWIVLALTGLVAGVASSIFGIGGGLLIVPALLWILKFPVPVAAATSLAAMMLPVGAAISVYEYYTTGKIMAIHIVYGVLICIGMAVGAYFGSRFAVTASPDLLRKAFAVFLVFAAVLTWFKA